MTHRIWILPSRPDPEATAIRALLTEAGETIAESWDDPAVQSIRSDGGHIRAIEREDWPRWAIESGVDCAAVVWRIDHHRQGDPGYGRQPAEFLSASSLGQVIAALARLRPARRRDHRADGLPLTWPSCAHDCVTGATHGIGREWLLTPQGWHILAETYSDGVPASWVCIPHDLVMTAAADHCLGAAYRGECPGVDPEELLRWRMASRADFQGRSIAELLADVERARELLRSARSMAIELVSPYPVGECPDGHAVHLRLCSWCCARWEDCAIGGHACSAPRDLRGCGVCHGLGSATGLGGLSGYEGQCHYGPYGTIPELVDAAMLEGVAYVAGPGLPGPDGACKIVCSGPPEVIEAFIDQWAPAQGLDRIYGDPARGFAGGYV